MWVNSPFQNCGLLPPISHVWRIWYLVTSPNLAKRLSLGVYSTVGVDTLVTSAASTAAFTLDASVASAMNRFCLMSCTSEVFDFCGDATTSCTFHCGIRPFSVLRGDAVVIHSRLRSIMKPASPVNAMRKPRRAPRLVPNRT